MAEKKDKIRFYTEVDWHRGNVVNYELTDFDQIYVIKAYPDKTFATVDFLGNLLYKKDENGNIVLEDYIKGWALFDEKEFPHVFLE